MDTVLTPFALLFTLVSQTVSSLTTCPKCGATEVPHPFSTDPTCGDPRYSLQCIDNALYFPSARGSHYKILSLDPTSQRLTISPPEIEPTKCYTSDFAAEGLRLADASPFNISARNTVVLLNCSDALLRSPLNCSASSLCRRFEDGAAEGRPCRGTLCCHYLKDSSMNSRFIRVRDGGCTAYTSVVNMNGSEPVDKWNYGVELQWVPPN